MNELKTSKQIFNKLLEILCVFDELCNENNIQYSLYGGTLLGAVREHSFIPWDDDADVIMTRANYKCLESVLRDTQSKYVIRGNIKKQFCEVGDPHFWIDIFVCDYISDNFFSQKAKQYLLTLLDIMYRNQKSMKLSNLKQYSWIKRLGYRIAFAIGCIIPKNWTVKLYGYVSEKCFLGKREKLFRSNDQYMGRKLIFPAQWMERFRKIDFVNKRVLIIEEWDRLLIQSYGEDYMIPVHDERNLKIHDFLRSEEEINL